LWRGWRCGQCTICTLLLRRLCLSIWQVRRVLRCGRGWHLRRWYRRRAEEWKAGVRIKWGVRCRRMGWLGRKLRWWWWKNGGTL
jgi:hypothetical protein